MEAGTRSAAVAYRAILLSAVLLAFGLLFRQLVPLLVAGLVTVIISIPLSAAANFLQRYRVPRAIGAIAALLLGLAILSGLITLIITPFVDQLRQFINDVPGIISSIQNFLGDSGQQGAGAQVQEYLNGLLNEPEKLIGPIVSIGVSVAGIVAAIILILVTAVFIAVRPWPLVNGVLRLFPPTRRDHALEVLVRLRSAFSGWMRGVIVDMVVSGVLLYIGLTIIGLDFAIVFAVLTALLVVVPYFGSVLGAIPPVAFAATISLEKALLTLAIYVIVQQLESNVIIPLVMSRAVSLHPALVALGVVLVGILLGFAGLFLAVPILSLIVILVEEYWVKPQEQGLQTAAARGPPG